MRDGLRPEVRTNKNGVAVTKHVRDSSVPASRNRLLAAIAPTLDKKLAEKAERRSLLERCSKMMEQWCRLKAHSQRYGLYDPDSVLHRRENLSKYSLENLRYVASVLDADTSWEEQNCAMTIIDNRSGTEDITMTGLRYRSLLGDPKSQGEFFKRLHTVERYFHDEEYLPHVDENSEEWTFNLKVVSFSLRMFGYMEKNDGRIKFDYDDPRWTDPITRGFVRVLRDYPDSEEDIFGFMKARGLAPYMVTEEMLRDYLNAPSAPLRTGAL